MRIVYKFEIVACDLQYTDAMEAEKKFYRDPQRFEETKEHNRYAIIKLIGENTTEDLSFSMLKQHGLRWAPQGPMKLSNGNYKELLNYIESYF